MNVFWREEPLNEHEAKLLQLCFEAHAQSALRQNMSSVAVVNAAVGSGDYVKAVTAGLMTLGGVHAPLMDTWRVLVDDSLKVKDAIAANLKIPGWGNGFEKEVVDPLWKSFVTYLDSEFDLIGSRIRDITQALHDCGKIIFPNPSAFTAATGIALRMPPELLPWLFLNGRLNVWSAMFFNTLKKG